MTLDRTALLARCREEEARWRELLGLAVADRVTTRLQDIPGYVLDAVDPEIVVKAALDSLTTDPAVLGLLKRAHRWAVAEREAVTPPSDHTFPRPRGAF